MKKIVYIASAASHIANFHADYIQELRGCGFEVQTFTDGFEKNKNLLKNIALIFKLSKIIRRGRYDIISTHATLAGAVGRLAALFYRRAKVLHTCHGYLFNDDKSMRSRAMIMLEKFLSLRTDLLFVMNQDDYIIAKKYKLCRNIKYISGMGLNPAKLSGSAEINIIEKYNLPGNKKYMLCVGEFSKRKSQRDIIQAVRLVKNKKDLHVIFLGGGALLDECRLLCESFGLRDSVTFCGHVSETSAFYRLADCVASASRFEGLPFNILEALHFNKPVIASSIKGHKDLIKDNINGYLYDYGDCRALAEAIGKIGKLKDNAYLDDKYLYENVKKDILEEYINYL